MTKCLVDTELMLFMGDTCCLVLIFSPPTPSACLLAFLVGGSLVSMTLLCPLPTVFFVHNRLHLQWSLFIKQLLLSNFD